MAERETISQKLEKGRAEFAYKCANEGNKITQKNQINNEYYEDDKYTSYAKKMPTMILTNGLGQTLAFIVSKRQKVKDKNQPGTEKNPKNAYDLIYKHLTDYLKSDSTARKQMPKDKEDLLEWVISCDSSDYRYTTQELLAFLNWLKRFAEGMIEGEKR